MIEEKVKEMGKVLEKLPDHRKKSNATKYSVKDAALSAFGVFFMQSPSFLSHQRDMKRSQGKSNMESLFGGHEIPSDNQIRKILDPIEPKELGEIYWKMYEGLEEEGKLEEYRSINGTWLCGMDGTQYYSSKKISCEQCNQKKRGEEIRYSHSVIAPVIVSPRKESVITLEPEFIWPQDGREKEDCEQNAIKRWIERHAERFEPYTLTILTDDLHSRQPTCELCIEHKLNFILTCKPESHPTLYQEVGLLGRIDEVKRHKVRHWNGRFHRVDNYRYLNSVPLRAGEDALRVNWCEITSVNEETGEILYKSAFITNFVISAHNVIEIVSAGRARWKTENECHNTLKNHGYHLEHNFGHGQRYLSMILLSLNLLAFLTHTLLELTETLYQQLRDELGSRQTFFNDLRTLTRYLFFDSWSHLLHFMSTHLAFPLRPPPPS